jgi:prevent-host-death family protein
MEEFVREVDAAKNKLGQLLDLVEQGEEITITRHGREVARLVTVRSIGSREEARAALRRIRERAEQSNLDRVEILPGRRPLTLAWIYGDETTEPIRRVFDLVDDDGAVGDIAEFW